MVQGFDAAAFSGQPHSHLTALLSEHFPLFLRLILSLSFPTCALSAFAKANRVLLNFVHELDDKSEGIMGML